MDYKNTADTMKASAVTPGRAQKSPSRGGAGHKMYLSEIIDKIIFPICCFLGGLWIYFVFDSF